MDYGGVGAAAARLAELKTIIPPPPPSRSVCPWRVSFCNFRPCEKKSYNGTGWTNPVVVSNPESLVCGRSLSVIYGPNIIGPPSGTKKIKEK